MTSKQSELMTRLVSGATQIDKVASLLPARFFIKKDDDHIQLVFLFSFFFLFFFFSFSSPNKLIEIFGDEQEKKYMKNKKGSSPMQDLKDARRKFKMESLNPKIKKTVPEIQQQMFKAQQRGEDMDEDEDGAEDEEEDEEEEEEEKEEVRFHGSGLGDLAEDDDEEEGDDDDEDEDDDDNDDDDDDDDDDEEEEEEVNEERENVKKLLAQRRANLGPSEEVRKKLRMRRNQKKLKEKEKLKKKISDKIQQKVHSLATF